MTWLVTLIVLGASALDDQQPDFKGIELFEIRQADPYPTDLVRQIAARIEQRAAGRVPEKDVEASVEPKAYRAEIVDPRKHTACRVNLFVTPLRHPFSGGRMAVAVDQNGDIVAIDLMDHADFSKDDFSVWFTYLYQFLSNPSMNTEEFNLRAAGAADGAQRESNDSPTDHQEVSLSTMLANQRQVMKSNRLLLFHLQRAVFGGEEVSPDWFVQQVGMFQELQRESKALERFLSEAEVAAYRTRLEQVLKDLNVLKDSAAAGDLNVKEFKQSARALANSCKACHTAIAPGESETLQTKIIAKRKSFDQPAGLFKVGLDVALAPGMTIEAGRSIADALRTLLRIEAQLPK